MTQIRTPAGADQFNLRLPNGLRDRIKQTAEDNGRSMNAEVIAALLEAFPEPAQDVAPMIAVLDYVNAAPNDAEFFQRVAEMNERLASTGAPYTATAGATGRVAIIPKD